MKERGIIMAGDNPKLILEGRKTQTRRIIKLKFPFEAGIAEVAGYHMGTTPTPPIDMRVTLRRAIYHHMDFKTFAEKYCPYGVAGDRLYVKETHWRFGKWVKNGVSEKTGQQKWKFKVAGYDEGYVVEFKKPNDVYERTGKPRGWLGWHKRPSIFLPKKLARTWLEITKVRVERLQDISENDAIAEGMLPPYFTGEGKPFPTNDMLRSNGWGVVSDSAKALYRQLWDSLHGKGAWVENPWVWVIEFKKV